MIPREIFTSFAEFPRIVSENDFWLPTWFQQLLQAPLCFLRSFVLRGFSWILCVAKSCTTTACRWLFRDSQLSLRTLWSAVIKSPKFSTRGTAPPLRLLHGVLVILVLCQISQFRSFGKWVSTLCLHKSSREYGLKGCFMRETGVRVSMFRNFVIHQIFSEFLQPLWDFRIITGLSVLSVVLFCLFFFFLKKKNNINIGSSRSLINRSWHSHWRDVTFNSIFSFSSLNFTYCRWRRRAWRRCWAMTPLSRKCPWSWWIKSWRRICWQAWNHDRNEVLRDALYLNTVFNEMWFLTIDPFIRISVFIAKLSKRQYCWRILEDFHGQEYVQFFDIHKCLFMRLHFSIGG